MIQGIGIEVVDVRKFKSLSERRGERFLRRVFTDGELSYGLKRRFPERHLAARFACKVALFKALGRLRFRDVEVLRGERGEPVLKAAGLGEGLKPIVSISHSERYAVAEVVLERSL